MSKPSTKQKVKDAAENLLLKLIDSLDSKKDGNPEEIPPNPPPKPASYLASLKPNDLAHSAQNLLPSFNSLNISGPHGAPASPPGPGFVGGFHPGYVPNGSEPERPPLTHASSAPPPLMPVPFPPPPPGTQSLAMQMALDPGLPLPPRPSSTPGKPSVSKPTSVSAASTPTKPKPSKASPVQTPTKASRPGSSSPLSTPSGKAGQVQCSGRTKAGPQCTRMVKAAVLDLDGEDGELNPPIERFCHQHTKEVLKNTGYYSRKNGVYVEFSDWIPAYLHPETRTALQVEMDRSRSQSDVDGYIYTFEIRDKETETIKLKVGRAVNLTKRIDQWSKQCGSKEQVLRGYFPGPEAQGEAGNNASMMKGRVKVGEKSPCCHRLERLIHLELTDLVSTRVYLDDSWPAVDYDESTGLKPGELKREQCEDCGSLHKEIFEFERWPATHANHNKEWEQIVEPVIQRWGKFVELYV